MLGRVRKQYALLVTNDGVCFSELLRGNPHMLDATWAPVARHGQALPPARLEMALHGTRESRALAVSRCCRWASYSGANGALLLAYLPSGEQSCLWDGVRVSGCAFAADSYNLAAWAEAGAQLHVFELRPGQRLIRQRYLALECDACAAAFTHDATRLVACERTGGARTWALPGGTPLQHLPPGGVAATCCCFADAAGAVVIGSAEGLSVWDATGGACERLADACPRGVLLLRRGARTPRAAVRASAPRRACVLTPRAIICRRAVCLPARACGCASGGGAAVGSSCGGRRSTPSRSAPCACTR